MNILSLDDIVSTGGPSFNIAHGHNHMSQLSSQQLLKSQRIAGNQHFLKQVRRSIHANQQRLSREVYNVDNRNVKKFAQEWLAFRKKFQMGKEARGANTSPAKRTDKKYQQNELLELSFAQQFKQKPSLKTAPEDVSALTIRNSSRDSSSIRNVTFKTSLSKGYSVRINYVENSKSREKGLGARQKSNSFANERYSLRKRMATQWEQSPRKEEQSRLSLQKADPPSNSAQYRPSDEYIIDVDRQRMEKFIRNLHRLEWACAFLKGSNDSNAEQSREFRTHMRKFEFDADSPIDEQAINLMISRRYHLHTNYLEDIYEQRDRLLNEQAASLQHKQLADSRQYPLLNSLSNHSILGLLAKNVTSLKQKAGSSTREGWEDGAPEALFALPFSEFISHRETKNSIYQLVGMSAKQGLKLAFTIFDKNRNGLIDEDDLIQLISLSRTMPTLEIDIAVLSRGMLTLQQPKKPFFQKSKLPNPDHAQSRLKDYRERNLTVISKESENISRIEEEKDSDSESQLNPKSLSTSRFSMDKLYTFLREKERERGGGGKMGRAPLQSLNFLSFCKAFGFKRPYLVYDLLQFIFGASVEDFKPHIQAEINAHLGKLQSTCVAAGASEEEETLEEKWNRRLKISNAILQSFIRQKQDL